MLQVCVECVGYLLEELRDAKNYAAFQADMRDANIFIGSLIFIEELADKARFTQLGIIGFRVITLDCRWCPPRTLTLLRQ